MQTIRLFPHFHYCKQCWKWTLLYMCLWEHIMTVSRAVSLTSVCIRYQEVLLKYQLLGSRVSDSVGLNNYASNKFSYDIDPAEFEKYWSRIWRFKYNHLIKGKLYLQLIIHNVKLLSKVIVSNYTQIWAVYESSVFSILYQELRRAVLCNNCQSDECKW